MRIIDAFPFYNELEILQMRFEVLYPHVDYFVLVEANQTFTLKHSPKELTFWDNKDKFEKYWDKIIHVPLINKFKPGNPWRNEYFQRDAIFQNDVVSYESDDILIMSDVDEIPDPETFLEFEGLSLENQVLVYKQKMFRYYLNIRCTHELWGGSRVTRISNLINNLGGSPEKMRGCGDISIDAGFHYTGIGEVKQFIKKMQSFSHADICDTPEYTDEENMKKLFQERVIEQGRDVHHFNNATYQVETDPKVFLPPQCDVNKYRHLIYDPKNGGYG